MSTYFTSKDLLETPSKRAAYSDRTSYLMAEMSRLAYFKFEGGNNIEDVLEQVKGLVPDHPKWKAIEAIVRSRVPVNDATTSKAALASILTVDDFALIDTFVSADTDAQAFLCVCAAQNMAILSFRGTEPNLKDIKADIRARLKDVKRNGKTTQIHTGYWEQFESLEGNIIDALKDKGVKGKQLFITGHSLGGALAITATKFLASDIAGACYTFGSPPVGTKAFDYDVRTPIYRIINHIDIVPRLPDPILVLLIRLIGLALGIFLSPFASLIKQVEESNWYDQLSKTLIDAQKYRQCGYGSYLVGEGSKARLRYNVHVFDKFFWWLKQLVNVFRGEFKLLSDHSIDTYSKKLATWAHRRTS